jgi:hypothetical protein
VRNPAAAQNAAQVDPAGPPPTIATSNISIAFHCRKNAARIKAISRLPPRPQPTALARDLKAGETIFMSWSLPILRIAGIQLRIHITFLLLIGWLAFGYYEEGGSAAAAGRVFFILLLFLCVVLH